MLLSIKHHYSQHISKAMDFDLQKYADCYAKNNPFPHIILHNFWNETILSEVAEECLVFRDWDHETSHKGSIRKKICSTLHMLPEKTSSLINYCNSSSFLQKIEINF